MFTRPTLVIYDLNGSLIAVHPEGISNMEFLPFEYPSGVPYLEIPYGSVNYHEQYLVRIDLTDPENPVPVFEAIEQTKTPEQLEIEKLKAEIEALKGGQA